MTLSDDARKVLFSATVKARYHEVAGNSDRKSEWDRFIARIKHMADPVPKEPRPGEEAARITLAEAQKELERLWSVDGNLDDAIVARAEADINERWYGSRQPA